MNPGILTQLLNDVVGILTLGYARLMPDGLYLMRFFICIELILLGLYWAFGKKDVSVTALKKVTYIFFFLWVLGDIKHLTAMLVESLAQAGITASGHTIPLSIVFDPSSIATLGFISTQPLFDNMGLIEQLSAPIDTIILGLLGLVIIITYFLIAINCFLVVVEFYIFTVCSVLLIPFAIFKPTSFLAERAIGATFALTIKVMVLSLVMGLTHTFLSGLQVPTDPDTAQIFHVLLGVGAVAFLCWQAPSMAVALFSGSPNLSGETPVATATAAPVIAATQVLSAGKDAFKRAVAADRTIITTGGAAKAKAATQAVGPGKTSLQWRHPTRSV
jgi:type IV secretion system protein TrbL